MSEFLTDEVRAWLAVAAFAGFCECIKVLKLLIESWEDWPR